MSKKYSNFSHDFSVLVEKQPKSTAVIIPDDLEPKTITYEELDDLINRFLGMYSQQSSLKKGGTIVAMLPNSLEFMVGYLAAIRGGYTFAPLSCTATSYEVEKWLDLVQPGLCLTSEILNNSPVGILQKKQIDTVLIPAGSTFAWLPDPVTEEPGSSTPRLFISTSGTTGDPKALIIDSNKLWSSAKAFVTYHNLTNKRLRFWNYLPMSYLGGLFNLGLIPLSVGGSILIDQPFSGGTFLNYWQTVDRYEINTLWLVPTIVNGLLKFARRLPDEILQKISSRVNHAFLGTAPITLKSKKEFEEIFGITLLENYGLSETTFISSERGDQLEHRDNNTTGEVLPYVEIMMKDIDPSESSGAPEDNSDLKEICIKSPYLFDGYLEKDGSINIHTDADGFYCTGDLGEITESGQLKITGRIKDILKKGGYFVSLTEIEKLVLNHNLVHEAAAVKAPHKFYGESYNLYIKPSEDVNSDAGLLLNKIESYLHSHLVKYKWPEKIYIQENFPKTSSGKIKKHLLTETE